MNFLQFNWVWASMFTTTDIGTLIARSSESEGRPMIAGRKRRFVASLFSQRVQQKRLSVAWVTASLPKVGGALVITMPTAMRLSLIWLRKRLNISDLQLHRQKLNSLWNGQDSAVYRWGLNGWRLCAGVEVAQCWCLDWQMWGCPWPTEEC